MARRSYSRSARRTTTRRSVRRSPVRRGRAVRRSSGSRSRSTGRRAGGFHTIRLVLETPQASSVARPQDAGHVMVEKSTKKSAF